MDSVRDDWSFVIETGKHVKDGLLEWQPHKNHFAKFNETFDVSKMGHLCQLVSYTGSGPEHEDASVTIGKQMMYERGSTEHFIVQLFRIPSMFNFQIPYVKLMQIAYNIGQTLAHLHEYDSCVVEFFVEHKLDQLDTFVCNTV
jgi:hypothetical protein